jgi:hypothetical protein
MMSTLLTALANAQGFLALLLLLPYLDRLRMLRWREHLARVVAMHLAWSLWLGSLAFDGLVTASLDAYHLLGLAGAGLWLLVSQATWRAGPPGYTHSGPMPLQTLAGDVQHPEVAP